MTLLLVASLPATDVCCSSDHPLHCRGSRGGSFSPGYLVFSVGADRNLRAAAAHAAYAAAAGAGSAAAAAIYFVAPFCLYRHR